MAIKQRVLAALVATALAGAPVLPAAAGVHGPGFGHAHGGWGFGHGLFGAAAALVEPAVHPGCSRRVCGCRIGARRRAVVWLPARGELRGSAAGLLSAAGLSGTGARLLPGLRAARPTMRRRRRMPILRPYPYSAVPRAYYGPGYQGGYSRGYTYSGRYGYAQR